MAISDNPVMPNAKRRRELILSLELRGMRQKQIAAMLGLAEITVYETTRKPKYQEAFNARLGEVDDKFLQLKPKVFSVVDNGLEDSDPAIGLRSAELWFKAMGYKGFGKGDPQADRSVTAEDIASQLLAAGGGRVTIDVASGPRLVEATASQGQETSPNDD